MTALSPNGRLAAGIIAALGWFALGLQLVLIIGTTTAAGGTAAGAVVNFLSFFTILVNTIVAVVMTRVAFGMAPGASALGAATLYIAVVGVTYSVALRHIWNPQGWQMIADRLLHDLLPVLAVLFWLVFAPKGRLAFRDILPWLVMPIAYLGYCLVRGAIDGWYPYYFIDVGKLGYGVMVRNALIVTALFGLLGVLLVGLDRLLGNRGR